MFVVVDGPNLVGKSSLIAALSPRILTGGFQLCVTSEPTDGILGEFARSVSGSVTGEALACLFAADRHVHSQAVIVPAVDARVWVLCDRFVASGLAYAWVDEVPVSFADGLNAGLPMPDVTILLTAPEALLDLRRATRNALDAHEARITAKKELDGFAAARAFLLDAGHEIWDYETETTEAAVLAEEIYARLEERAQ